MPLQIRRLDHSDAALLRELRVAALADSPREFGETLDEALNRSDQGWIDLAPSAYLAELDGRPVGMAFAFEDRSDPATARVGGMWVAPSLCGAGIGFALLQTAVSWATAESKRRVRLWAIPGTSAERLYRRASFVRTGLKKPFPGDSSRVVMEMQLDICESDMEEEVLRGGFVNSVVRVGDTVRRIPGNCTPTIHRLLSHVRERGVTWVPEPLGYDTLGREMLTFIPGAVPHETPDWVWSEAVLIDVARALRQWHDATIGFGVAGSIWGLDPRDPPEVICHNDFAPYNCVFRDGRLVGAIDFDTCAPGPRLWDIAYTAYRFVPLMPSPNAGDSRDLGDRSPFGLSDALSRLDIFLDAYSARGAPLRFAPSEVIASTIDRLQVLAAWTTEHARTNGAAAIAKHGEMYLAHARWLSTQFRSG